MHGSSTSATLTARAAPGLTEGTSLRTFKKKCFASVSQYTFSFFLPSEAAPLTGRAALHSPGPALRGTNADQSLSEGGTP